MSQPFRPHSSEKWWYNNKNTLCNIYTLWHLATPFLVFFSFPDTIISGHVIQISDFLRYRKIKVTDFSEAAKFWKVLLNDHYKILCKLASGHALTCLRWAIPSIKLGSNIKIKWFFTLRQNIKTLNINYFYLKGLTLKYWWT